MNALKKVILVVAISLGMSVVFTSCRDTKKQKTTEMHDSHEHGSEDIAMHDAYQCPMDGMRWAAAGRFAEELLRDPRRIRRKLDRDRVGHMPRIDPRHAIKRQDTRRRPAQPQRRDHRARPGPARRIRRFLPHGTGDSAIRKPPKDQSESATAPGRTRDRAGRAVSSSLTIDADARNCPWISHHPSPNPCVFAANTRRH